MIRTVIEKELLLLGNAKNGIFSLLTLILTFIFIFHYSLERINPLSIESLIGLKWAILFLLSFVYIGQSVWEERDGGAIRINAVYLPASIFFLSKGVVIFLVLFFVNLLVIGLFYIFFSAMKIHTFQEFFYHVVFLIPAGLSLSFLGITLTALSNATRLKEVLLPILLIPLSIPVLLFGMEAERNLILYAGNVGKPLLVLFAFCTFYGSLGIVVQELSEEI